jgi:hypothetical protein
MKIKDLLKLDFKTLLLIGLIVVIVLMRACESTGTKPGETIKIDGKKYEVLKHEIDTVLIPHDTVVYKKGKDIYHDTTIYVEVPSTVDTSAIIRDYYAKRIFIDTLKLKDSLGYIVVNDTVSENTLLGRLWNAQVNKISIKETLIVKDLPKNQVYIGLVGGFDKQNIVNFAGPSLLLKTKSDKIYSVGVGYSASKVLSLQGSIYWKIKLKK